MHKYGINFRYISKRAGSRQTGFTLLEFLIVILIGAIIMTAVMTSFFSQHRAYLAQDEIVAMSQNLRAAMDLMTREIRMAGYDPTGAAGAGIVAAASGQIEFAMDSDDDGSLDGTSGADPPEWVTYRLNGDSTIGRRTGTGNSLFPSVAENFSELEFNYILHDGTTTLSPIPGNIRGVQISLLARTGNAHSDYTDTKTYESGSGAVWGPFNDGFRRQLMVRTVMCRNLGL